MDHEVVKNVDLEGVELKQVQLLHAKSEVFSGSGVYALSLSLKLTSFHT